MIYQIIPSVPDKCKPLLTNFRTHFWNNSEDNNVSSIIFDMYFNLQCVNTALNKSTYSILIIREIKRIH